MPCQLQSSRRPHSSNKFLFSLFSHQQTQSKHTMASCNNDDKFESGWNGSKCDTRYKNTAAGLELMEQLSWKLAAILETVLLSCAGLGLSERMCELTVPNLASECANWQWEKRRANVLLASANGLKLASSNSWNSSVNMCRVRVERANVLPNWILASVLPNSLNQSECAT